MTTRSSPWLPAVLLGAGCLLNFSVDAQRTMSLAAPLNSLPMELSGFQGQDFPISAEEARVAGTTTSVLRVYSRDTTSNFSVYVGYYARQRQGKTIHSPKNCLPGAGWEPLESRREIVLREDGSQVRVNRFVIAKKNQRALVYYWYQGRGRTEANEYQVKLDLIRDSALRRRSEEALVRIVVPLSGDLSEAEALARRTIRELYPELVRLLPA